MAQAQVDLITSVGWMQADGRAARSFSFFDTFRYERNLKRVIDILLASVLLVVTLPIWAVIAIAIKLDSSGPVIFRQERVGRGGKRFSFYKFRSMWADAEKQRQTLLAMNEMNGPVFKMRSDPRITRLGRLLRRSSLDELPQLINVLRGDMSIVGPRPALPAEVGNYRPTDLVRLWVKPGLTCWWQVRGRSGCDFDTWMLYDREYVQNISLRIDLTIMLATFRAVLTARGAY